MQTQTTARERRALLTRDRTTTAAPGTAPANPVTPPANVSEALTLVEDLNRGVNDLRQRAEAFAQTGADVTAIRGELAAHAQRMADMQDALTRLARPALPASAEAAREERIAAFGHWLRTGDNKRLVDIGAWKPEMATRAAQGLTSSGPYGGYIVLDNLEREIDRISRVFSNLREHARVVTISQGDRWSKNTKLAGAAATRTSEQATRVKTDALKWAVNEIFVHEAEASPEYSRQSLADPYFALESEIIRDIGEAYGLLNSVEHVSGSGVGQPQGFMSPAKAAQTGTTEVAYGSLGYVFSGHATGWSAAAGDEFDIFTHVRTALKPEYLANAKYFMNRVSLGEIMLFKDANDLPVWQPSMQVGVPSSLRGYPVALIEHMASRGADTFPVAFGDMAQYYTIVDRLGMDMLSDPYTNTGFVTFWTWKRDGAKVMKSEALKAIKIATS